jgi:hypothetical protein
MENLKPKINLRGYERALKEYGSEPARIIEELVANSYDADSTSTIILYSDKEIAILDDGKGIDTDQFPHLLDLGAGTKISLHESNLKRSYLGSFGFGIKAIINIAKYVSIFTINKDYQIFCPIDLDELRLKYDKPSWEGFVPKVSKRQAQSPTGTIIYLKLHSEITQEHILNIEKSLQTLPKARNFNIFFSAFQRIWH